MKNSVIKLLALLLIAMSLVGCSPKVVDKDNYMDYFVEAEAEEGIVDGSFEYYQDKQVYYFYIENISKKGTFFSGDLQIQDKNEKEIYNGKLEIIRPGYYTYEIVGEEPSTYEGENFKYYTLEGPADFEYDYFYDYAKDEDYYFVDIFKKGGFTEKEVINAAKQEYIIAQATKVLDVNFYFFDASAKPESGFDTAESKYYAQFDYDAKTITITDVKTEKVIKTITMKF